MDFFLQKKQKKNMREKTRPNFFSNEKKTKPQSDIRSLVGT